jgi:hypothetical protein
MGRFETPSHSRRAFLGQLGAMLFDPKTDPLEMKNLADDPKFAQIRTELSALTRKYAASVWRPSGDDAL